MLEIRLINRTKSAAKEGYLKTGAKTKQQKEMINNFELKKPRTLETET